MNWKTMDSFPKDGELYLLAIANSGNFEYALGRWIKSANKIFAFSWSIYFENHFDFWCEIEPPKGGGRNE